MADAGQRLEYLRRDGPTTWAFTFRAPFPVPDAVSDVGVRADENWYCPA